jgi:hypothetical protein
LPTGIDEKHTPDKACLLTFLSTYMPGLDIFKKSYVAPPRQEKFVSNVKVELPDDFLDRLPASRKKVSQASGDALEGEGEGEGAALQTDAREVQEGVPQIKEQE